MIRLIIFSFSFEYPKEDLTLYPSLFLGLLAENIKLSK